MELLDQAQSFLASEWGLALMALAIELGMRYKPTAQALSMLHLVAHAAQKIADILKLLADASNKVLPQKLK